MRPPGELQGASLCFSATSLCCFDRAEEKHKGSELNLDASKEKVAALTAPRNVVLVSASDRPGSWAARVWHNLNRYEFPARSI